MRRSQALLEWRDIIIIALAKYLSNGFGKALFWKRNGTLNVRKLFKVIEKDKYLYDWMYELTKPSPPSSLHLRSAVISLAKRKDPVGRCILSKALTGEPITVEELVELIEQLH